MHNTIPSNAIITTIGIYPTIAYTLPSFWHINQYQKKGIVGIVSGSGTLTFLKNFKPAKIGVRK